MLEAYREIHTKKRAEFFYDLILCLCAPHGDAEYLKDVRRMWRQIADGAIPEFKPPPGPADGGPMPWQQASHLMLQQMRAMRNLVAHG